MSPDDTRRVWELLVVCFMEEEVVPSMGDELCSNEHFNSAAACSGHWPVGSETWYFFFVVGVGGT